MLQHSSDNTFTGGNIAGKADDVFPGRFTHKDSITDNVTLFYLKNPNIQLLPCFFI
jgi:hypothetical protein